MIPPGSSLIPMVNFERIKTLLDKALCMDPSTDGVPIYELVAQARSQCTMAGSHDAILRGVFGDGRGSCQGHPLPQSGESDA